MDIHDPIDPKAYSSYDDYQKALKQHDEFIEKAAAVDSVMKNSKDDAGMRRGMEELGFTWVEDDTCGRPWCKEKEECLWVAVESHQDLCNDTVFDHLLAQEDLLLSDEEIDQCLQRGCDALPEAWHDEESREHRALIWFISVSNAILLDMERDVSLDIFIAKHPVFQEFYRQFYLCTLQSVRGRPWRDAEQGKRMIANFLQETSLLPRGYMDDVLERFRAFVQK
jgi:hypothetical protein